MLIIKFEGSDIDKVAMVYSDCIVNYKGLKIVDRESEGMGAKTIEKINKRLSIAEKNHYSLISFSSIFIESENSEDNVKILRDYIMALNRSEMNARDMPLRIHIRNMETIASELITKLIVEIKKLK